MTTSRFFVFNLFGNFFPMVVALFAMPTLSHFAGTERLGAVTLVWTLVGYFSFLDFGLSRVVTRRIAQSVKDGRKDQELAELRRFFWQWVFPALIFIAFLFLALRHLFQAYLPGGTIGQELQKAWPWIAWSLPLTLASNWLRGILEGLQRFARVSMLRSVFGTWTYAAPALVAIVSPTLDAMVFAIFIGRLIGLAAHAWLAMCAEPGVVLGGISQRSRNLVSFVSEGGWMSVSNLISPIMVYFDRFVLATLVPGKAVAWYATPQEAMLGARLIPGALAGVLFPQFAAAGANHERSNYLYRRGIRVVSALMLPVCVMIAGLAYDGMRWWMGAEFAHNSYQTVEILAVGLFANSIAQLPFALLQGVGRPKLTAQIHMVELPLYVLGLYAAVSYRGIEGAAWVWSLRVFIDCIVMLMVSDSSSAAKAGAITISGLLIIALVGFVTGPQWGFQWRIGICLGALAASIAFSWFILLTPDDRADLIRLRYAY